jgi:acyl-coenzyme A synthetase/AMP-(fatty) acid ligase
LITYAQLGVLVSRIARGLLALGVRPRDRVALCASDLFASYLLILGLDWLGCAIAPINAQDGDAARPTGHLDWSLTDFESQDTTIAGRFTITPQWFKSVVDAPSPPLAPVDEAEDDPVHLRATSGTTGKPKGHEVTRRMMTARIHERAWHYNLSSSSRYLVAMPLTVGSVYAAALSCVYAGAAVIFETRPLIGSGTLGLTTHTTTLPLHLRGLLDSLPNDFAKPAQLTILALGAPVSQEFRKRLLERLATRVINVYGTNETGTIAARSDSGPYLVMPTVSIRIVDDTGQEAAQGRSGHIGVRSPGTVAGYLGEDHPSQAYFRDGWFYPGDIGLLRAPGQLEILGRADELLNIGGQKVSPLDLEERLHQLTGAKDVGLCTLPGGEGLEQLCVALAGIDSVDNELLGRVSASLGNSYGPVSLVTLPELPRNAAGKLVRRELRRVIEQARQSKRG